MPNPINKRATVQSAVPRGTKEAAALKIWESVCGAGAQCAEVQADPVASQALTKLKDAVTTANKTLTIRIDAGLAVTLAIKNLRGDYRAVENAARIYQSAVAAVANGDDKIINKSGLKAHIPADSPLPLGKVSTVRSKPGKDSAEAILTWPAGPGATGYAIEVNFTPQNPAGPWMALIPGTGRRRTVKAPAPGAQFLARVASLGSGGTQSEWSDPVLCVAAY